MPIMAALGGVSSRGFGDRSTAAPPEFSLVFSSRSSSGASWSIVPYDSSWSFTVTNQTGTAASRTNQTVTVSGVNQLSTASLQVVATNSGGSKTVSASTYTTGTLTYTSSGTFTVPNGLTSLDVTMRGGGGGGAGGGASFSTGPAGGNQRNGGGGGGGGGGGTTASNTSVSVTPGDVLSFTVGAGGAGGAAQTSGSAGGGSSVPALSLFGGSGGSGGTRGGNAATSTFGAGGAGGSGSPSGGNGGAGASNFGGNPGTGGGNGGPGGRGEIPLNTAPQPGTSGSVGYVQFSKST